jgi:hypothetical protein
MALRRKKKPELEKDQPDKPWTREDFLRDLRKVARPKKASKPEK